MCSLKTIAECCGLPRIDMATRDAVDTPPNALRRMGHHGFGGHVLDRKPRPSTVWWWECKHRHGSESCVLLWTRRRPQNYSLHNPRLVRAWETDRICVSARKWSQPRKTSPSEG